MTREERLAAALRRIIEFHSSTDGMGWTDDGGYGRIDPACEVCGTSDEYAVPWPCTTVETAQRALAAEPVA